MGNSDRPFGLEPWGNILGTGLYAIATAYGTAVFNRDQVEHNGTSYATKYGGAVPGAAVEETGAAGSLLGSVLAVFDHNMDPLYYLPASTTGDGVVAGYVLVADHPMQKFLIQEDGDTTPVAAASIGLNADCISTHTGDTNTGRSKMELDSDTVNTTSTLGVKIHEAHPDDTINSAYCRFIVSINSHHNGSNIDGV